MCFLQLWIFVWNYLLLLLCFQLKLHYLQLQVVLVIFKGQSFIQLLLALLCLLFVLFLQLLVALLVNLSLKQFLPLIHAQLPALYCQMFMIIPIINSMSHSWFLINRLRRFQSTFAFGIPILPHDGSMLMMQRCLVLRFWLLNPVVVGTSMRWVVHILHWTIWYFPVHCTFPLICVGFMGFSSKNLIDFKFTESFRINTFSQWDNQTLSFRPSHLRGIQFGNSSDVLGSLVGEQVKGEFKALFVGGIFDGDSLIEDETVIFTHRGLPSQKGALVFYFHFAGEFDDEFDRNDGEMILVVLSLNHIDC